MAPLERDRRCAAHRGDGAACGRRRARRFLGAGGGRLERPRRHGHGRWHDLHRFLRTAVGGLAAEGKVSINRILVDGRAIAAGIVLRSGRGAWFWKIAYDESFARFSPGVMLTVALTNALLEDAAIERADSCATENHPMIDRLWRERLALCDRLVALRPQAPFGAVRRLEALRAAAIAAAKSARDYLRG